MLYLDKILWGHLDGRMFQFTQYLPTWKAKSMQEWTSSPMIYHSYARKPSPRIQCYFRHSIVSSYSPRLFCFNKYFNFINHPLFLSSLLCFYNYLEIFCSWQRNLVRRMLFLGCFFMMIFLMRWSLNKYLAQLRKLSNYPPHLKTPPNNQHKTLAGATR